MPCVPGLVQITSLIGCAVKTAKNYLSLYTTLIIVKSCSDLLITIKSYSDLFREAAVSVGVSEEVKEP